VFAGLKSAHSPPEGSITPLGIHSNPETQYAASDKYILSLQVDAAFQQSLNSETAIKLDASAIRCDASA